MDLPRQVINFYSIPFFFLVPRPWRGKIFLKKQQKGRHRSRPKRIITFNGHCRRGIRLWNSRSVTCLKTPDSSPISIFRIYPGSSSLIQRTSKLDVRDRRAFLRQGVKGQGSMANVNRNFVIHSCFRAQQYPTYLGRWIVHVRWPGGY